METLNLTNKNLRIGMVLMIAVLLMSCGAGKSVDGGSDLASRVLEPVNNGPKPLAYCSQAVDSTTTTKVILGTAYDMYEKPDPNYVHLKILNVPASFKDDNNYIALWKWYAESSGFTHVSSSPLAFKLINVQTGTEITSNVTTLSWGTISSLASQMNVSTPTEFFQRVRILVYLNDPSAQYDAVTVAFHAKSDGKAVNRVDALIPIFHADPRDYAVESSGSARAMVLQQLHPFYSSNYSQWSANTFTVMANDLCTPLQN
jgi:hypothetical protein